MDPQQVREVASRMGLRDGSGVAPPARVALALAVAVGAAVAPRGARADESALSGTVGWAAFSFPDAEDPEVDITSYAGGALALEYERAFGESVSGRIELAGAVFHHEDGTALLGLGDVGVTYRFDVLKWVPYLFGGVGAVITDGGPLRGSIDPVIVLGGGLDILQSRSRSYGGEVRLASFAGDVTTFTLGFRYTIRWGYF
jgi:hypothetical protein